VCLRLRPRGCDRNHRMLKTLRLPLRSFSKRFSMSQSAETCSYRHKLLVRHGVSTLGGSRGANSKELRLFMAELHFSVPNHMHHDATGL
jgi:hypothetical protein